MLFNLAHVVVSPNEATKIYIYGNRCGHNPDDPRYFQPSEAHKLRPSVIQFALNNVKRFYENPTKWLQSLKRTRTSKKQERSEARESDADVIGVLLHYTELSSLRVGFHDVTGDFISLDMRFIARQLGWRTDEDDKKDKARIEQGLKPKDRGIKRVWRSIARLKRAGYLTVQRKFKVKIKPGQETQYKGIAAIRTIHQKLFIELGISLTKLSFKRREATKRLKKKGREYMQKAEALVASIKNARTNQPNPITSAIKSIYEQPRRTQTAYDRERANQKEKERTEQYFQLKQLPENKALNAEGMYEKYPYLKKQE